MNVNMPAVIMNIYVLTLHQVSHSSVWSCISTCCSLNNMSLAPALPAPEVTEKTSRRRTGPSDKELEDDMKAIAAMAAELSSSSALQVMVLNVCLIDVLMIQTNSSLYTKIRKTVDAYIGKVNHYEDSFAKEQLLAQIHYRVWNTIISDVENLFISKQLPHVTEPQHVLLNYLEELKRMTPLALQASLYYDIKHVKMAKAYNRKDKKFLIHMYPGSNAGDLERRLQKWLEYGTIESSEDTKLS